MRNNLYFLVSMMVLAAGCSVGQHRTVDSLAPGPSSLSFEDESFQQNERRGRSIPGSPFRPASEAVASQNLTTNDSVGSYVKQTSFDQVTAKSESGSNSPAPPAPTSLFTLEDIQTLAVENSPSLKKALAEIESLRGKQIQVGLRPNPQFGYSSSDVGEEDTAGQQGAFLSQNFIRGNKLGLNQTVVCREIDAAVEQYEIEKQRVINIASMRFYDLLVAQERVNLLQQFESQIDESVAISSKLRAGEEISRVADMRAQLQRKTLQVQIDRADAELVVAQQALLASLNMLITNSIVVAVGDISSNNVDIDAESLLEELVATSPEIRKAERELETAQANLTRQRAEPIRDVSVQTALTHGNATGDDLVAVQVGVPLLINDRNQGNIRSAHAEIMAASENIEQVRVELRQRFATQWQSYQKAVAALRAIETDVLPASKEVFDLTRIAFREGELGYLDLVSAQQVYLDASLDRLSALTNFWKSAVMIDGKLIQ